MNHNLLFRPLILGGFAVTIALASGFLLSLEFGAAPPPEAPQGRPVPVPEPPPAALSTPEPVSSPQLAGANVAGAVDVLRPEPRPIPSPDSLTISVTMVQPATEQPWFLLVAATLLGVVAAAAHIVSRVRAVGGVSKTLSARLQPAAKW